MSKFYTENFEDIKKRPNSERKSRTERRAERRARRAKRRAERRARSEQCGFQLIPGVKNRYIFIAILLAIVAYYMMCKTPQNK